MGRMDYDAMLERAEDEPWLSRAAAYSQELDKAQARIAELEAQRAALIAQLRMWIDAGDYHEHDDFVGGLAWERVLAAMGETP